MYGVEWPKSCCSYCPFTEGRAEVMARYRRFPDAAAHALFLELVARVLNPRMTLYSRGRSLRSLIEGDGNLAALDLLERRFAAADWAVCRVHRVYRARASAYRDIVRVMSGSRTACRAMLAETAARVALPLETHPDGRASVHTMVRQGTIGPENPS
jgi:hypothetical protein